MTADVPISPETARLIALRRAGRGLSYDRHTGLFHAGRPVPAYLVPAIRDLLAAGALRLDGERVLVTLAGQAQRDQLDARRRNLIAGERRRESMPLDPWPVRLFPTESTELLLSTDLPSRPDVRPFGLAMTTVVTEDPLPDRTGLRYDPVRQLTVDVAGEPVATAPRHAGRLTDRD